LHELLVDVQNRSFLRFDIRHNKKIKQKRYSIFLIFFKKNSTAMQPRHVQPVPEHWPTPLRLQIITVDAADQLVDWTTKYGTTKRVEMDWGMVTDNAYFTKAYAVTNKRYVADDEEGGGSFVHSHPAVVDEQLRQHAVHIFGRTPEGYSVLLQVNTSLGLVLEFPDFCEELHMQEYLQALMVELDLKFTYTLTRAARSNGWVPDKSDPTQPRKYSIARLAVPNRYTYDVLLTRVPTFVWKHPRLDHGVHVALYETLDYIRSTQRFLLEQKLSPGGWIVVRNAKPMIWTISTCDYGAVCDVKDVTADEADQSVCPLTIMSWDIECINGTLEDRKRMQALGLDKFPRAEDPTNQVIQMSIVFSMTDKRQVRYLLEMTETQREPEQRVFDGVEYQAVFFTVEQEMLLRFRDLLVFYDPDIVLSFNGDRFDWPYILARMGKVDKDAARFTFMGRSLHQRWDSKYTKYRTLFSRDDGKHWSTVKPADGERFIRKDEPVVNMMFDDDEDEDETPEFNDTALPGKNFPLHQLALLRGIELTPELTGRVSLDLCSFIRAMSGADKYLAFKNYTLDNMAQRFLGDEKVDFTHNDIFDAWNGMMTTERFLEIAEGHDLDAWLQPLEKCTGAELKASQHNISKAAQRRLLGDYCLKDTLLPLRILEKLGTVMFLWQVARVAQTPPHNIINNGQMLRVSTMFIGEAWRQERYVIRLENRPMAYQGATVLSPKRGYYGGTDERCAELKPQPPLPSGYDYSGLPEQALVQREVQYAILTLDFKSLYPSIMLSHLLCPSNLWLGDEPLNAAELCTTELEAIMDVHELPYTSLARRVIPVLPVAPDDQTPSGIVDGLDDPHYITVCIVVTDKKTRQESRRYHKFNKHQRGIYPTLLQNLLDGRDVYKKKMNLDKAVYGTIELALNGAHPPTGPLMPLADILPHLDDLRALIKPLVKDREARLAAWTRWQAEHVDVPVAALLEALDLHVNIYDGRQKALKVMANSIYGVSGAKQHSPCACCQLAESVTAIGRQMHEATTHAALTTFAHYGTDVIYGDTDSIMVSIREPNDVEAWRIMTEMADHITSVVFAGTINVLEAECIKRRVAFFKKKNYVGMENEDVKTGIYHLCEKGVSTVRRDKPEVLNILVRQLNKAFTELGYLPTHTIARVLLRVCMAHFERLVTNEFPLDDYNIAQRINKTAQESAHLAVAEKMQQRAGVPINRGDTVNYVHIIDPTKDKARDKVDATVFVRSHPELKIDRAYYLANKIQGIVASLLDLFLPPEVIGELFAVYQFALEQPDRPMFGVTLPPDQHRRQRLEQALAHAIQQNRMPLGARLITPLNDRKRPAALPIAEQPTFALKKNEAAKPATPVSPKKKTALLKFTKF
jgi:DNA polymerase elongation subunit (family B)